MRRSDLKKKERYSKKRVRPIGYPAEVITLKNGKVVGGYGVKNGGDAWYYLTDGFGASDLQWRHEREVKKREAWTPKRQVNLEQPKDNEHQSKLTFAKTKMLFIVNADGREVRLLSDFKGNILNEGSKYKTVTAYLQELTETYGEDKVNYEYKLR